jgi:hypothetical protein
MRLDRRPLFGGQALVEQELQGIPGMGFVFGHGSTVLK